MEIFGSLCDGSKLGGLLAFNRPADYFLSTVERVKFAEEAGLQAGEPVAHRIKAKIDLTERDRRRLAVIALARADQHQRAVGSKGELRERAGEARARLDHRDAASRGNLHPRVHT